MARLDEEARRRLELPELIADALSARSCHRGKSADTTTVSIEIGEARAGHADKVEALVQRAYRGLKRIHEGNLRGVRSLAA